LKKLLCSIPILAYPTPDHQGWVVDTDASDKALGAVLSQVQEGVERVIAYASKRLSAVQQIYCETKKELLALKWALEHFRPYLYGRRFLLRTDHSSLRYWRKMDTHIAPEIQRWISRLQEYEFCVEYRPGKHHGNADGVSRPPLDELWSEEQYPVPCRTRPCTCKERIDQGLADPYEGEAEYENHPDIEAALQSTCCTTRVVNAVSTRSQTERQEKKGVISHAHPGRKGSSESSGEGDITRTDGPTDAIWDRNAQPSIPEEEPDLFGFLELEKLINKENRKGDPTRT
jgi:hypothetical protein